MIEATKIVTKKKTEIKPVAQKKKEPTPIIKKLSEPKKEVKPTKVDPSTIKWWDSHSAETQKAFVQEHPKGKIADFIKAKLLKYGEKVGGGKSEETGKKEIEKNKKDKTLQSIEASDLSPKEKEKVRREYLANQAYVDLPDEIKKTYREQVHVLADVLKPIIEKFTSKPKKKGEIFATDNYLGKKTSGQDFDNEVHILALNKQIVAPGNDGSLINEVGTGICLQSIINEFQKTNGKSGIFIQKGKINIDALDEYYYNVVKKTSVGQLYKDSPEKLHELTKGAVVSAITEFQRIRVLCKDNNIKLSDCEISHVWGSKQSKHNACSYIKNSGIKTVNGQPVENYTSDDGIIQKGGEGENPTDTMILIKPKKGVKAFILHTSNKIATDNIQGNSSVEECAKWVINELNSTIKNEKKQEEIKKIGDSLNEDLKNENKKIRRAVGEAIPKYNPKTIDYIKSIGKESHHGKRWEDIKKRFGVGTDGTDKEIYNKWREHCIFQSTRDDGVTPKLSSEDNRILGELAKLNPEKIKEVNKLYLKQFDRYNKFREQINNATKPKKEGNKIFAKLFFHRLHIDGHNKGGIESKYFELNMSLNKSGIRFDNETGRPCMLDEKTKLWRVVDINGNIDEKIPGRKQKETNYDNKKATSINDNVLTEMFDEKLPLTDDFFSDIEVSDVEYKEGTNIGTATIYKLNKKGKPPIRIKIGTQTIRSKSGPTGKPQDMIVFDKEFQQRAVIISHYQYEQKQKKINEGNTIKNDVLYNILNDEKIIEKINNPKNIKLADWLTKE